jgi:hypothetical protein
MMSTIRWFIAAAVATHSPPLPGNDIPVEVRWSGARPSSINISTEGGLKPMRYDERRQIFTESISVTGSHPQRRTLIVSYGTFNHPLDIRVHSVLPSITFGIDHQPQPSCTQTKVLAAGSQSNNLPDAIKRMVGAGQLLSIQSPNDCDQSLRLHAAQARYRQNVRMGHLSQGLFLVNDHIKNDYLQLASQQGVAVNSELAAYAQAEAGLEAVQLVAARTAAQEANDFAAAAEINGYIEQRLAADVAAREVFAQQGITQIRLAADSRFLNALATSQQPVQAAAER